MRSAKHAVLRGLIAKVDIFLFMLSPLAILTVLVILIVLADRYAAHQRSVAEFEQAGISVIGTVQRVNPEDELIFVNFPYQGEARIGLMYTRYYPQALEDLREGQSLPLRVLPTSLGDQVVWADQFARFKGYWGYAVDPLITLVCAWALVILHPEFLYLGYADVRQVSHDA